MGADQWLKRYDVPQFDFFGGKCIIIKNSNLDLSVETNRVKMPPGNKRIS